MRREKYISLLHIMVMLLSIGTGCCVRYNINEYYEKKKLSFPTHFFDWIMSNLRSVCEILEQRNAVNKWLSKDKIQDEGVHKNHRRFRVKSIDKFISIHDVPPKFGDKDINDFLEKYKRRLQRFVELIQESKEKIYFIHCVQHGDFDFSQIQRFINIIKEIKPSCSFDFVLLKEEPYQFVVKREKENYIHVNLKKLIIKKKQENDWKHSHFHWSRIFDDIQKL